MARKQGRLGGKLGSSDKHIDDVARAIRCGTIAM
jgi:hypothetical protein